jgi:3-isopropylmalate dehydratase small subunit
MSLKNAIDNLRYDSRMIEINLKSQTLTRDEYKKVLEKLPDLKANAIEVDLDAAGDDIDDMIVDEQ